MMKINHNNLDEIIRLTNQQVANPKNLIPKVIQFGTGVLLRGLPDYYIDQANRLSGFNGAVVVIKSTQQGDISAFESQNYLYTIQTEGIENGQLLQKKQINTCITNILTVQDDWNEILKLTEEPDIQFIISNTTESGIIEVEEDVMQTPISYPGRVLALLFQRYKHFQGVPEKGLIILPTELIENNADKLKSIVLSIATKNNLPTEFIDWIHNANYFCNTLVDRIVPGKVDTSSWEYQDDLAIAVEPFNLWAIEAKDLQLKQKITFASSNPGIKLVDSIEQIKELKIRLLNATHTFTCPVAILAGHHLVKETLNDKRFEEWIRLLMKTEIKLHLLQKDIKINEIDSFIDAVVDRFKNPFIDHLWSSIAQNSTQKWKQRILPILQSWDKTHSISSNAIALSLACYLKCHELDSDHTFPKDPQIQQALEQKHTIAEILAAKSIWETNLSTNISFVQLVEKYDQALDSKSILQLIS